MICGCQLLNGVAHALHEPAWCGCGAADADTLLAHEPCGIDVILDIDVQGAVAVKKRFASDPVFAARMESVFIAPPSYAELERRLRGRGTDAEESILKRLANSKREMTFWQEYKYVIVNDDLDQAAEAFSSLIRSLRLKTARYKESPFHED